MQHLKVLMFFGFLWFLTANAVNCKRIENDLFLRTVRNNSELFKFYYPNYENLLKLIDHLLPDQAKNVDCKNSLLKLKVALQNKEEWALKYHESNGRVRDGFLSGLNHDLGNYDLCMSIGTTRIANGRSFDGQFCLVSIKTPFLDRMRSESIYKAIENTTRSSTKQMIDFSYGTVLGFCVPSTCEFGDLLRTLNKELREHQLEAVSQTHCTRGGYQDKHYLNSKFFIFLFILSVPCALVFLSLFVEHKALRPFSLKENFNFVYTLAEPNDESFLSGIKVIYLIISIPSHLVGILYSGGLASFLQGSIKTIDFYLLAPFIDRFIIGIDLMFFISGFRIFLSVYEPIKQNKLTLFKVILFWALRLFPGYLGYLCVLHLLPFLVFGIYKDLLEGFISNCQANGWKLLTFTSNYDHFSDQCNIIAWFNSVNVQLSFVHYLLLLVFIRKRTLALTMACLLLVLNVVFEGWRMLHFNVQPYISLSYDIIGFDSFEKDYGYSHNHLVPFTLGWLVGSVYKTRPVGKTEVILTNPLLFYGLFIASFACNFISLTFPELFERDILPRSPVLLVLYFTLKRFFYAAPLIFLIFVFRSGPSKVKNFFSLRIYQPLSKLCSSLITVQFLYFFYFLSTRKETIRFTIETLCREFVVCVIYCFFAGNLFYFFFERPVSNLFKEFLLFILKDKRQNDQQNVQQDDCKTNCVSRIGPMLKSNDLKSQNLEDKMSHSLTDSKEQRIDINHNDYND